MNEFKMGQKVWCFLNGWGKIVETDRDSSYCIGVEFDAGGYDTFTENGVLSEGANRTLFFKEIQIPVDALVPPVEEIVLKKGDIVLFKNGQLRYVASDSGSDSTLLTCHDNVPQNLDSAFDYSTALKQNIKKVVGNIND